MLVHTAILIIIDVQFQVFQRFSRSKLVLKTVESCFVALNYYENGSIHPTEASPPNPRADRECNTLTMGHFLSSNYTLVCMCVNLRTMQGGTLEALYAPWGAFYPVTLLT